MAEDIDPGAAALGMTFNCFPPWTHDQPSLSLGSVPVKRACRGSHAWPVILTVTPVLLSIYALQSCFLHLLRAFHSYDFIRSSR